jgi:hypothetical protein
VAPGAAPSATRAAAESFPVANERVGSRGAHAERWKEPGFEGDWIVFRLEFPDHGIEIGLPVLEGRQSPSLFWIPLTYRGPGQAPAPPPIDPAERFGIKFERFTRAEKSRHPWSEGYLTVPGMRVEMPMGWWPAASLRSSSGYPVRIVHDSGQELGFLVRLEADELPDVEAEGMTWEASGRAGVHRAESVYSNAEHDLLYVHRDGYGFFFRLTVTSEEILGAWERMAETVQLMRTDAEPH